MLSWTCIVLFFVVHRPSLCCFSLCSHITSVTFPLLRYLTLHSLLRFIHSLYATYRQDGSINTTQAYSTLPHLHISPFSDGFFGSLTRSAHAQPLRTSRADLWHELHNMRPRTPCKFLLSFVQPADWRHHLPAFQRRKICNMLPCGQ